LTSSLPKFSGGLVPAVGPDGEITWQAWTYAELIDHLSQDILLPVAGLPPGVVRGVANTALLLSTGTFACNFPGAINGTATNVAHGLGKAPITVLADPLSQGTGSVSISINTFAYNAIKFDASGRTVDGVPIGPGNVTCNFIAVAFA
jgi:hypothetical protein